MQNTGRGTAVTGAARGAPNATAAPAQTELRPHQTCCWWLQMLEPTMLRQTLQDKQRNQHLELHARTTWHSGCDVFAPKLVCCPNMLWILWVSAYINH